MRPYTVPKYRYQQSEEHVHWVACLSNNNIVQGFKLMIKKFKFNRKSLYKDLKTVINWKPLVINGLGTKIRVKN